MTVGHQQGSRGNLHQYITFRFWSVVGCTETEIRSQVKVHYSAMAFRYSEFWFFGDPLNKKRLFDDEIQFAGPISMIVPWCLFHFIDDGDPAGHMLQYSLETSTKKIKEADYIREIKCNKRVSQVLYDMKHYRFAGGSLGMNIELGQRANGLIPVSVSSSSSSSARRRSPRVLELDDEKEEEEDEKKEDKEESDQPKKRQVTFDIGHAKPCVKDKVLSPTPAAPSNADEVTFKKGTKTYELPIFNLCINI